MGTGELFKHDVVKTVMGRIGDDFTNLSDLLKETNELVTTALGSPDKAVYGRAGNKILATWDENCSTLNSFMSIYDSWSTMAVSMAKEFTKFDEGVAMVSDKDAANLRTIANLNKTTWLKTPEGRKNYVGSTVRYIDPETQEEILERQGFRGFDSTGGGSNFEWRLVTDKNGKIYGPDGKKLSQDELLKKDEKMQLLSSAKKELEYAANASEYAIEPHSRISDEERKRRLEYVGGACGTKEEQDAKMVNISVPIWNGEEIEYWDIRVNAKLQDNYMNAFREIAEMRTFVIVRQPGVDGAYNYSHATRSGGEASDHTLGTAIDINVQHNWGEGDDSEYAIKNHEEVIAAFARQGFFWGGDWDKTKDAMHFTFTGY